MNSVFNFFLYNDDIGQQYAIKLSNEVAAAGGFSSTVDPRGFEVWPYGAKNLRHVWGKAPNGSRARLCIADLSNALYVGGGSFNLGGTTYEVQGAIGEVKSVRNIA